ncbi:MAG: PduM family microcompartment protein [Vagococcus sp.]
MDEIELINAVKERLVKRETATIVMNCQEQCQLVAPPKTDLFYDYRHIELNQVPIKLLHDMYQFAETPWVDWLLTGISYQVIFMMNLNEFNLPFVPWKMLTDWPILFTIFNRPIYAFNASNISRNMLIMLPKESVLVTLTKQNVTAEAKEYIDKNKIKVIERFNESCIWAE